MRAPAEPNTQADTPSIEGARLWPHQPAGRLLTQLVLDAPGARWERSADCPPLDAARPVLHGHSAPERPATAMRQPQAPPQRPATAMRQPQPKPPPPLQRPATAMREPQPPTLQRPATALGKPQPPKLRRPAPPVLCVSIHDVAPATWADCLVLWGALREVAPRLPITWLVVPRYHGSAATAPAMEATLERLLGEGHEMALHGYTHVDGAARRPGLRSHFVRNVYTRGEGEFAAIERNEALQRLDLGLAWFAERGWPVSGFVPPAWLASAGARRAVRERPFAYTTSLTHFHVLQGGHSVWSPSLMYTARQAAGRWLSPPAADIMALALSRNRLVRLGLHPADARHPALLRHAQALLARLLAQRQALTKRQFAGLLLDGTAGVQTLPDAVAAAGVIDA